MQQNTFTYKQVEKDGLTAHLLTAQEYPWMVCQVLTFEPSEREKVITALRQRKGGWAEFPGRKDFAIIQVGSSRDLNITQQNYKDVDLALRSCMRNAAVCWANQTFINGND